MIGYATRTGTRRNLRALHDAGWRQLLTPGQRPTRAWGWLLDNGAWSAHQNGTDFDDRAFVRHVIAWGRHADAIVLPDIVAGGLASLDLSLRWIDRLANACPFLLLPVQDGMEPHHIAPHVDRPFQRWSRAHQRFFGRVGIFVGGSTEWKLDTLPTWGDVAKRYGLWLHVGRVNTARRIRMCAHVGAHSFDGTSATRFSATLPLLDSARRQLDLFGAAVA